MNFQRMKIMGWLLAIAVALFPIPAYPYSTPDPALTFYSDANGDQQFTSTDYNIHLTQVLGGSAPYNTPQPNNEDQKWNTCDVTGDLFCSEEDLLEMDQLLYGMPITTAFNSWEIVNVDLPAEGNIFQQWIPFKLSVRADKDGTPTYIGRPGVIVKLTIAPDSIGSGKISGRACPVPSDQCVVSVSVSNWLADQENAFTEDGENGFKVYSNGDGDLRMVAEFAAQPLLLIPATSLSISAQFEPPYTVWRVDGSVALSGDGQSWDTAIKTIPEALNIAEAGDRIWVVEGIYTRPIGGAESVITMKPGIAIYGGFAGNEHKQEDRGDPLDHLTVLDGGNGSYHVVVGASNARLDGFTITRGAAESSGQTPQSVGGGLYNESIDDIAVANCIFTANAAAYGGAMYNGNVLNAQVSNCAFSINSSPSYTGGVYNYYSTGSISDSGFDHNSAYLGGAAMYNYFANMSISGCAFDSNVTTYGSGGISNWQSSPQIYRCAFRNNEGYGGGALSNGYNSSATVVNCLFNGNHSTYDGGAVYNYMSAAQIRFSSFSGNYSNKSGGAIYNLYGDTPPARNVVIENCILWGDSAQTYPEISDSKSSPTVNYNDIQGGYSGTIPGVGNFSENPQFAGYTDLHLPYSSPCVDRAARIDMPTDDLDGNPRPTGAGYDLGSYEYAFPAECRIALNCPASVGENNPTSCSIEYNAEYCTGILDVGPANTCSGAFLSDNGNGTGTYTAAAQGESAGPGTCAAQIQIIGEGLTDTETVTINEQNAYPSITVDCPPAVDENGQAVCSIDAGDTDIPNPNYDDPGYIVCSLMTTITSCENVVLDDCASLTVPTQGGGSGSCDVVVQVIDGYGATYNDGETISLIENKVPPTVDLNCPGHAPENQASVCSLTPFDPDIPNENPGDPGYVTCSLDTAGATCSNVTINDCTSVDVPAQGESAGGGSCAVAVKIEDGYGALGGDTKTIIIDEVNSPPYWSTEPADIFVSIGAAHNKVNGIAADIDLPNAAAADPGYITCSARNSTCSFLVKSIQSGAGTASCMTQFTAKSTEENCSVDIVATDGSGLSISVTIQIGVISRWYVDDTATGRRNGSSWADAFNKVSDAMAAASSGVDVWVAEGNYTSLGTTSPVLTMKNLVDLFGGFAGTENLLSERGDPSLHPSVLNGQNISLQVVIGSSNAVLDGFTIANGKAGTKRNGGGMYNVSRANLQVANCIFKNNSALNGGGMANTSSSVAISNCRFEDNRSSGSGAALYISNGSATISDTSFSRNIAVKNGGGIYETAMTSFQITRSVFDSNQSYNGGGIYYYNNVTPQISKSIFRLNTVTNSGGGIYSYSASPTIVNCVFADNHANQNGGAVLNYNLAVPKITNCTIYRNTANNRGGGISNWNSSNVTVKNSILWANTAVVSGEQVYNNASTFTISYSDIQNGWAGTGNINVNPLLRSADDLHLQNASPCKNAANSAGAPTEDYEGYGRPSGPGYDMGAYEYQDIPCSVTLNCPANVDENDPISCPVTYTKYACLGGVSLGPLNTCSGASVIDNGNGTGNYNAPAQGEAAPSSCDAQVQLQADNKFDIDTIVINEICSAPTITNLPDTKSGRSGLPYSFSVTASDPDLPPENLTFTNAGDTCSFDVNVAADGEINWTCGGSEICSVEVQVADRCSPPMTDLKTLTIECQNNAPIIETTAPASVNEGSTYTYNVSCSDGDNDPLSLMLGTADTCISAYSGSLIDNGNGSGVYSFPTTEADGPADCNLQIVCSDTLDADVEGPSSIAIEEDNQFPYWTDTTDDLTLSINYTYNNTAAYADDDDLPETSPGDPGYITCTTENNTCSFSVSASGAGPGVVSCDLNFTAGPLPESCSVDIVATDGMEAGISQNISITVVNRWYVDADATGEGTGLTWADAFNHPSDAAEAASGGAEIWVAEGTYSGLIAQEPVIEIKNGVLVYGGFAGTETSLGERGNPADYLTVLDGIDSSRHVIISNADLVLDGFTITRGNADGGDGYLGGAGLLNKGFGYPDGSVSISNCVFTAHNGQSSVDSLGSDVDIQHCEFSNNVSGGLYSDGAAVTVADTDFIINDFGISANNTFVDISDCLFEQNTVGLATDNVVGDIAGCLFNQNGTGIDAHADGTLIMKCAFEYNGTGIYNHLLNEGGRSPKYVNSRFLLNTDYGINNVDQSSPSIVNCSIAGNGIGIANINGSEPNIRNCIIYSNSQYQIYDIDSSPSVTYSDVSSYYPGEGNIGADPHFTGYDLRIDESSPCVNSGTAIGAPSDDFEGNPRPLGIGYDMGMYEYPFSQECMVKIECPEMVNEIDYFGCSVRYSDLYCVGTLSVGTGNTCSGVSVLDNEDGTGTYDAGAQGENAGPGSCVAEVSIDFANDTFNVQIDEINRPPYFTSVAPNEAAEGQLFVYNPTFDDDDIPDSLPTDPGYATCVVPYNECDWLSFNGCDASGTPPESAGGTSCAYYLSAIDGYYANAWQSVDLDIVESNQSPYWTVNPSNIALSIGQSYSADNGQAADDDLPNSNSDDPGYVECSTRNNTCSFSITTTGSGAGAAVCRVSFGTVLTPESCAFDLTVTDGLGAALVETISVDIVNRWYVNDDAAGAGTGISWADAFNEVQDAIDASAAGCEVWVAEGNYYRPAGGTVSVATMKDGVDLYGGFAGTESDLSERIDPRAYPSVLDGEDLSYHVVHGQSNTIFDGFTVTRGNAVGEAYSENKGGGMLNYSISNVLIENCIFTDNSALTFGGAIFNYYANGLVINDCLFDANTSHQAGGIYNHHTIVDVTASIFDGNAASQSGAGIYNNTSDVDIVNCLFTDNMAAHWGGGIQDYLSVSSVTNCTFSGNSASYGGAFGDYGAPASYLTNCILWGDNATVRGKEIAWNTIYPTVAYSDIQGGYAGAGNINSDPLFVTGIEGPYYLSQILAGQASDSPCVDAGSGLASEFGMDLRTTRTDEAPDAGTVDMGYHYTFP